MNKKNLCCLAFLMLFYSSSVLLTFASESEVVGNLITQKEKKKKITGTVVDATGMTVIGASVFEKGKTNNGTITDMDGNFSLEIDNGSRIVISSIGFESKELTIGSATNYQITLAEDVALLDEVIVVGYGTQRKGNLTGAITSVKSDKLNIAPVTNVTNTLGGQLAGLKTKQTSGVPGADGASLSIRGFNAPLVIVDGVETNFSNIDASQIESISVLKDGAASIYGARAGNGVVLVTLKRGSVSKINVAVNGSMTFQKSTNTIGTASAGDRAAWEREAHINANLPETQIPWTLEQIQKFYDGSDPNYVNTDWISKVLRTWTPQQNHNVSVSGGGDKVTFYTYLGYNKQETMSRYDGGDYQRINLQNTMDAQISKDLKFSTSFNYIKEKRDFTAMNLGHSNYYNALYDSDPRYPFSLPDESKLSYAGSTMGNALFVSSKDLAGYSRSDNHSFRINGALEYSPSYLEGLKLKAFINYNGNYGMSKVFRKQPDFYTYNSATQEYTFARKSNSPTLLSQGNSYGDDMTRQYSIGYDKIINEVHSFSILALHERIDYKNSGFDTQRGNYITSEIDQLFAGDPSTASNNGFAGEWGRVSYIGRLNYAYAGRYLLETIFRADASSRFPKGGRWGYFPSVSIGWVASEESFIKGFDALDNLKLRASFGQSGDDGIGNYQYFAGYAYDMSHILGDKIQQGIYATGLANPLLSWEKLNIYNGGVDFSFFKRKLYGTIDGFYRLREGIPGHRTLSLPSSFGADLPLENLNSIDTRGFEVELGTAGKLEDFYYDVSANISWSRSKWKKYDEPDFADPDQKRIHSFQGKWTDERYGYVSDGVFTSQEEIDKLGYTYEELGGNSSIRPGDVKYLDVNGDGKLDWRDQVSIGKGTVPNWMYGINLNFSYKGISLQSLFQGAFDYTTYIDLETAPTELRSKHRWTEAENNRGARVPRPGSQNGANWWYSDYRNHSTSYLRLKMMSLGYDLKDAWTRKVGLSKARIYVAGTNLFTISSLSKYGVDPEAPEGTPAYYYPQQKTISVGVSINY